jgi:2,3-bisphosphoglycerate-dependent phosphoglycerate mutase
MRNDTAGNDRRRKRRRRRIQAIIIYTGIAIGLAWFFESQATTTIIFVRHAEKEMNAGDNPGLSDAGRRRVAELTRQLVDADVVAGIDAIYAADRETVLETILKKHKGKIILVIAHSDTLPELIANLGASKKVPPIDEMEYDNIYIISIPWFGKTKTIRLRFGEPYVPGTIAAA